MTFLFNMTPEQKNKAFEAILVGFKELKKGLEALEEQIRDLRKVELLEIEKSHVSKKDS